MLFHIIPNQNEAQRDVKKINSFYNTQFIKELETEKGEFFYSIPTDELIKKINPNSSQTEFIGLINKEYTITETAPTVKTKTLYKIQRFLKNEVLDCSLIDINTDLNIKLKKNVVFDSKGFAIKTQYYEGVNVSVCDVTGLQIKEFENLLFEEVKRYTVDGNNNLLHRNLRLGYYTDRNKIKYLVDKTKIYTEYDEREEGERKRRENVINALLYPFLLGKFKELSISTNYADTQIKLNEFKNSIVAEVSQFVNFSNYEILTNKISILGYNWLETIENNTTLRSLIIDLINKSKL